jgi:hypothetical protein|tara:strand:+ start:3277 stop:3726 length:450 start_codon:yes stop_codon:yes gene_type:complete
MTLSNRELGLLSNTDVLGYIQARNAEINAQAKAEGWQFWTLIAESLADEHANAYDLELRFARSTYSDVYKDWAGIRPSIPQGLTLVELEAEIDSLAKLANDAYQAEQEWLAEQDRLDREEIAMGLAEPTPETELEAWEIWEARAEEVGC